MTNPNDAIRQAMLRTLYDIHGRARTPKQAALGIRDLQRELRTLYGYTQQQVSSNLDYLVQKGWVVCVVAERTFTTSKGTTQQAQKLTYKISDVGIDRLEEASMYQRPDPRPHVNVTNIQGVTVLGDGNIVNSDFTDAARSLMELRNRLLAASAMSEKDRFNIAADIDTIQSQLQKTDPDKGIIRRSWEGIQAVVTGAEFVGLLHAVARHLGVFLS